MAQVLKFSRESDEWNDVACVIREVRLGDLMIPFDLKSYYYVPLSISDMDSPHLLYTVHGYDTIWLEEKMSKLVSRMWVLCLCTRFLWGNFLWSSIFNIDTGSGFGDLSCCQIKFVERSLVINGKDVLKFFWDGLGLLFSFFEFYRVMLAVRR